MASPFFAREMDVPHKQGSLLERAFLVPPILGNQTGSAPVKPASVGTFKNCHPAALRSQFDLALVACV